MKSQSGIQISKQLESFAIRNVSMFVSLFFLFFFFNVQTPSYLPSFFSFFFLLPSFNSSNETNVCREHRGKRGYVERERVRWDRKGERWRYISWLIKVEGFQLSILFSSIHGLCEFLAFVKSKHCSLLYIYNMHTNIRARARTYIYIRNYVRTYRLVAIIWERGNRG